MPCWASLQAPNSFPMGSPAYGKIAVGPLGPRHSIGNNLQTASRLQLTQRAFYIRE